MAPANRISNADSDRRTLLLDAAEQIMVEEGYAAVSSRRVGALAGTNATLVYYYFKTMDDLFIAVFRRGAERSLRRQAILLSTAQPLWGLWESIHDQFHAGLLTEFTALANHRKAVRAEIAAYSDRFRRMQIDTVSRALDRYGVDQAAFPPAALILFLAGTYRYLESEQSVGVDLGHSEAVALIERYLVQFEGERQPSALSYLDRAT